MATNPTFHETDLTSGLEPAISMPKIPGGFRYARIDAAFFVDVGQKKPLRCRVRERARYPEAKVVARCLGMRTNGELKPCPVCHECAAKGEDGLDELRAKHAAGGASEHELRKRHEQHVFVLFSPEHLDEEAHKEAVRQFNERLTAIKECKSALERQALCAEWRYDPRAPGAMPVAEIVGLLGDASWDDDGIALTM
jgi:hypothetical protein